MTSRPLTAPRARLLARAALLGFLIALFSTHPSAPVRAFGGENGRIAFHSNRAGNWEIYTMNPDGSDVVRLTNSPGDDERPGWSPDGTKIVFSSRRGGNTDIYVMNADGSGLQRLTTHPSDDHAGQWSSDGTKIVFRSSRDGNKEIYVMNADGSGQTNLSNNPAEETGPVWSPDGTRIAFSSNRNGEDDVYVMNLDGGNQTRLTTHPAADFAAAWSPDASKIAFRSERDGNVEIYVMNADGGNQTNLTHHPAADRGPAWSPDGTQVTFYTDRDGNYEIYAINADGSGARRITNHPSNDFSPDWGATEPDTILLPVLLSAATAGIAPGGLAFQPADILAYDPAANRWSMYFDASDVGVTANVTAFALHPDGALLLSFAKALTAGGLAVTPYDVVRFTPTATGDNTAGSFSYYFRGGDFGLSRTERIDALEIAPDGGLLVSTNTTAVVPKVGGGNLRVQREDVIAFNAGAGRWTLHFDGTPALGGHGNLGGYAIAGDGTRYATVPASFNLGGQAVTKQDILRLTPDGAGGFTLTLYWDGSAAGFPAGLDAVELR